ncbi:hypothetical protein ACFCZ3_19675 [Cellulosimicrobium cellulans]|uniref:hypothetical protein n=1 Tax=Cellulosimicrobium cellulans TaxID=1710 RepID=UPI0035DB9816
MSDPVKVRGVLDGVGYDVLLDGKGVHGSKRVAALVATASDRGDTVPLSPTGPVRPVKAGDPLAVLALLARTGKVSRVSGAPQASALPLGVVA